MKKLIYLLYAVFLSLMFVTFYIASGVYDGLVEENYYIKAKHYFSTKGEEEKKGFSITVDPADAVVGDNRFSITLSILDRPLTGASVTLHTGMISGTELDRAYSLRETAPGSYEGTVSIPRKGKWVFRVEIKSEQIDTTRKWFVDVI